MLYKPFLATNESWSFVTTSLAHTSFEIKGCRDKLYSNNFLLILGVAVRSGRLFSIAKADWGLESCSLYGVERWPFLRGCLIYIEVIVVVSIRT